SFTGLASPVRGRRRPEVALQLPREVRLRGEPGAERDVGDRPIRGDELVRGVVDSQTAQIRAERDSESAWKGAAEMNGMDAGLARDPLQRELLPEVRVQVVPHDRRPADGVAALADQGRG